MTYWGYLIGYGYLAMLMGIAEILSRRTPINREVTRKVLHCLIGLEWFVLYYCFPSSWQIVVIPATFIAVNAISYRYDVFRSIERKEGNHMGIVYYAVAMTAMSVATAIEPELMYPFGVAVMCLSFGDAAAALMGRYLKPRVEVFGKTVWGVVGCFLFSFAAQLALAAVVGQPIRWQFAVGIAVVCALAEVLASKGTDNLFVCLWCFVWAWALYYEQSAVAAVAMCFIGFVLTAVCWHTRAFSRTGSVVAGGMLAAIGLLGGWFPYLYILGAYGAIYLAEHFIKHKRYKETRSVAQILQNGLPALAAIIAYYCTGRGFLLLVYAVAITESLADSVASAFGSAYARRVVDIVSHRPVEKGLSGGVSVVGTLSALLVSALPVVVVGPIFGWTYALFGVTLLPFGGMLLDSVLGATLQHKMHCTVCGATCESTVHCGRPTEHGSGLRWLTNGRVNLLTNLITTGVAALVFYFIY